MDVNETSPPEQRFRALFAATYGDVVRFARRRTHPEHAEDIAAEALLTAWRRIGDLPPDVGDARAWVFGIARNCLLNDQRSERRRSGLAVRLAETAAASPPRPDEPADTATLRADLAVAWQRLSPTDQETLALVVFDHLTPAQSARVLGVTPAAFRVRLSRARATLRRQLSTDEQPAPRSATQEVPR